MICMLSKHCTLTEKKHKILTIMIFIFNKELLKTIQLCKQVYNKISFKPMLKPTVNKCERFKQLRLFPQSIPILHLLACMWGTREVCSNSIKSLRVSTMSVIRLNFLSLQFQSSTMLFTLSRWSDPERWQWSCTWFVNWFSCIDYKILKLRIIFWI